MSEKVFDIHCFLKAKIVKYTVSPSYMIFALANGEEGKVHKNNLGNLLVNLLRLNAESEVYKLNYMIIENAIKNI